MGTVSTIDVSTWIIAFGLCRFVGQEDVARTLAATIRGENEHQCGEWELLGPLAAWRMVVLSHSV